MILHNKCILIGQKFKYSNLLTRPDPLYEKYALTISKRTIRLAVREFFVVVEKSHSKRDFISIFSTAWSVFTTNLFTTSGQSPSRREFLNSKISWALTPISFLPS